MDEEIDQSQVERFKEIARMMECDDDPDHFGERLRKTDEHKPVGKPE